MSDKVKLTCHLLFLVSTKKNFEKRFKVNRGSSEYYKKISETVWDILVNLSDLKLKDDNTRDHQLWRYGNTTLTIGNYGDLQFDLEYYKSRVIFKTVIEVDYHNFGELFQQGRRFLECIEKAFKDIHKEMDEASDVIKFFRYPLVEIDKRYHPSQFEQLGEESMTTYYYEVNDPYSSSIVRHDILIRFSRPSIITTKMSNHSRSNLINVIYHSCLHPIRSREQKKAFGYQSHLSYNEYGNAREFIENVFYRNQAATSQISESRHILLLTAILGIASIATILAIIYFIPFLDIDLFISSEEIKSLIGIILLVLVIMILWPLRPKRVRQMKSKKNHN